ncbi:Os07g0590900 [Oryza sativa Japonica Group]|uniref:Os07g0590900 protein n=1 Tax=Oryza sativa subsp. japonica TaxID=39947 RepID=A0A0P0X810_ORYSJ|nr:Os07g0590900 [Oryza sativa Japonica Group]
MRSRQRELREDGSRCGRPRMEERWEPESASSSSSATPSASMLDLTLLAALELRLIFLSRSGQSSTKPTRPSWPSYRHSSMRRWCSSIGELEPAARCRVEEDTEHVLRQVRPAAGRVRCSVFMCAPPWGKPPRCGVRPRGRNGLSIFCSGCIFRLISC